MHAALLAGPTDRRRPRGVEISSRKTVGVELNVDPNVHLMGGKRPIRPRLRASACARHRSRSAPAIPYPGLPTQMGGGGNGAQPVTCLCCVCCSPRRAQSAAADDRHVMAVPGLLEGRRASSTWRRDSARPASLSRSCLLRWNASGVEGRRENSRRHCDQADAGYRGQPAADLLPSTLCEDRRRRNTDRGNSADAPPHRPRNAAESPGIAVAFEQVHRGRREHEHKAGQHQAQQQLFAPAADCFGEVAHCRREPAEPVRDEGS